MKGIKYGKLGEAERMFCIKLLRRITNWGPTKIVVAVNKLKIAKVVQRPWMCLFLKNGTKQGIGFSKQCRYFKGKDKWNEDIGRNIALSRAIRDMVGG